MNGERWLPVPGYEGLYEVSDHGRVRGPRGWVLKPSRNTTGYLRISLGRGNTSRVHRLVLLAFVGPPGPGQMCRHLDGDQLNNRLENLAWGTNRENQLDSVLHGTNHYAVRTVCARGHAFDAVCSDGTRRCRTCDRARDAARRPRQSARAPRRAAVVPSPPKTHCKNGHEYTAENTYFRPPGLRQGKRDCRECIRDRASKYRRSRSAA